MSKTMLALLAIPLMAALSACGSSGGGSSSTASFDEMARRGNALIAKYEDAEPTQLANMPTDLKASYRGVAAFSDVPDADYIAREAEIMSDIELNADFRSGAVDGELRNFRFYDNDRIAGTVAVRNGAISGNMLEGELAGNLTYGGGTERVSGALAGMFVGPQAEAIAGAMTGQIGNEAVYGIFGAER